MATSRDDGHNDDQQQYPPPNYGWLSHIQPIPPNHFPQAPVSMLFESSSPAHGRTTASETNFPYTSGHSLTDLHPAYLQPWNSSSEHNRSPYDYQANFQQHQHYTQGSAPLLPPMPQDVVSHANQYMPSQGMEPPWEASPQLASHDHADQVSGLNNGTSLTEVDNPTPKRKRGRPPKDPSAPSSKRRTGHRGGWSKGLVIGPRTTLEPSEQFTKLYNAAMDAFVDQQDYNKAMELVLQAIDTNPEIFAAHGLLAEIYFATGDTDRALDVLITGAHGNVNEMDTWRKVADIILSHDHQDHQQQVARAAYCFSAMLRKDGRDHEARYQRAQCQRELGQYNKALNDLNVILQDTPHNSSVLASKCELLLEIGEVANAKEMYDEHFEHYRSVGITEADMFEWRDVAMYADVIAQADGVSEAVHTLNELARWRVGRQDETFWNNYKEDDREWDQDDEPRRVEAVEFKPGLHPQESYGDALPLDLRSKLGIYRLKQIFREEAEYHFEWLQPDDQSEDAPVYQFPDTFLEVAEALQDAKEHEQALRFYEALHSAGIDFGIEYWLGLATSSYICGKKENAVKYYEHAMEIDPNSVDARTQLSKLYFDQGDRVKALQYGHEGLRIAQDAIPETSKRKYERKDLRVAREAAEKALRNAYTLPVAPGRRRGKVPKELRHRNRRSRPFSKIAIDELETTDQPSKPPKRPKPIPSVPRKKLKVSKTDNKAQHREEVLQLYQTLKNHEDDMRDGEDIARSTWMDCAQALIEDFRSQKVFYPGERHKAFGGYNSSKHRLTHSRAESSTSIFGDTDQDFPIPSVESNIPSDYCGVSFSTWLDIMLEYALLLANSTLTSTSQTECYATIAAATDCVIFYHNTEAMLQIHACWLACALALDDEPTLFNTVLRWFMKEYAFCTDTYRLYSAINLLYDHPPDKGGKAGQMDKATFRGAPNQKFMFRQIMSIDQLLPANYNANGSEGPVPDFMRQPREELRKVGKEAGIIPNTRSPVEDEDVDEQGQRSGDLVAKVIRPKEMDVVLFTLYAHIMMAGNSFPNALSYLYRAYSLDPKNPVCLLSMALCYMHQLFKRQSENRHMYLLQGWAWFDEYAKARTEWADLQMQQSTDDDDDDDDASTDVDLRIVVSREIQFNRARCWEMLGMADLAVRGYKKVLALPLPSTENAEDHDDGEASAENWTMETAYAMATIYALNGDGKTARQITEKYLVIE